MVYVEYNKPMKVIFLDFDGVLNSAASFVMEKRIRKAKPQTSRKLPPINQTLCHVCTSNFQMILEEVPSAKIVISSTWRELFDMEWLKKKLAEYGIDSSRVIDKTPASFRDRGYEIKQWLEEHPEVTSFVILDDNYIGAGYTDKEIVATNWDSGLLLPHVYKAMQILGKDQPDQEIPL